MSPPPLTFVAFSENVLASPPQKANKTSYTLTFSFKGAGLHLCSPFVRVLRAKLGT